MIQVELLILTSHFCRIITVRILSMKRLVPFIWCTDCGRFIIWSLVFAETFTFCRNLSWTPGAPSCSLADGYRRIFSLKLWSSSVMVLLPSTRVCTSSSQHKNQTHYCHSWFLFCRNCSRVQHINERYHCHPLVLLIWQEFLNNRCGSNIVGNNKMHKKPFRCRSSDGAGWIWRLWDRSWGPWQIIWTEVLHTKFQRHRHRLLR